MNREKVLQKILKCLRLSKSSNEHEAAAALRQAQVLMRQHAVSDQDLLAAEVADARSKSQASSDPPAWEHFLASTCADAFGCELIFSAGATWLRQPGEYLFIARDSRQLLCQYAFVVLVRQCRRARAEYIKKKLTRCRQRNRVARADQFCLGWVTAVRRTVEAFARSDEDRQAVAAWIASRDLKLVTEKVVARKVRGESWDASAGFIAADGVRLDRPVGGFNQVAIAGSAESPRVVDG